MAWAVVLLVLTRWNQWSQQRQRNSMATVDIVIPLYNKRQTIARAIRSIQGQSMTDWRLLVVDDGSTDGSGEVVRAMDEPRLELIEQANQGPGAARNAGIARARAEYLAFLDADDEWYPWYLENSLAAMREHADINYVATTYYEWPAGRDVTPNWEQKGVPLGRHELTGRESPEWVLAILPCLLCWNSLFKTDTMRRYGCFYGEGRYTKGEEESLFLSLLFNEPILIIGPPAARYHLETSEILMAHGVHRLEPFLEHPEIVACYCPEEKRPLLDKVLDYRAMWTAYQWAYYGATQQAEALLERYPGARDSTRVYEDYLRIRRRPWWWTRFKLAVGPPVRRFLGRVRSSSDGAAEGGAPLMPWESARGDSAVERDQPGGAAIGSEPPRFSGGSARDS